MEICATDTSLVLEASTSLTGIDIGTSISHRSSESARAFTRDRARQSLCRTTRVRSQLIHLFQPFQEKFCGQGWRREDAFPTDQPGLCRQFELAFEQVPQLSRNRAWWSQRGRSLSPKQRWPATIQCSPWTPQGKLAQGKISRRRLKQTTRHPQKGQQKGGAISSFEQTPASWTRLDRQA